MLWHGTYPNKGRYDDPRIDRAVGHRDEHQPSGRMLFALYYDFNLFKVQVAEKTAGKLNTRMPISMGGLLSIHYLLRICKPDVSLQGGKAWGECAS